jgi:hypothetical protein
MPINNPALYNAVLSAAAGGYSQGRVLINPTSSIYNPQVDAAKVFASVVDSQIPNIPTGATQKHVNLLLSICQNTLGQRTINSTIVGDYTSIASGIAAEYRAYHDALIAEPSTVVNQFFPIEIASDIPGFLSLVRQPSFGPEEDDSVTIDVTDGQVLIDTPYLTVPNDPGETSISGIWLLNMWRSCDTLSVANLIYKFYSRTSVGVESLILEATGSTINDTNPEYEFGAAPTPTPIPINLTDRIVLKVYAETSSAVPVTVHFYHDGTAHASYIVNVN